MCVQTVFWIFFLLEIIAQERGQVWFFADRFPLLGKLNDVIEMWKMGMSSIKQPIDRSLIEYVNW